MLRLGEFLITNYYVSAKTAAVCLDSPDFERLISATHAEVALDADGHFVLTNHSVNQTRVGQTSLRPGERKRLSAGETVIFGVRGSRCEFRYFVCRSDAPEEQEPPGAPPAAIAGAPAGAPAACLCLRPVVRLSSAKQ